MTRQPIVSDTGPLITWARAGELELLRHVFPEIRIPPAVAGELRPSPKPRPGSELVGGAWVKTVELTGSAMTGFPPKLGLGERQAIQLAQELRLALLLDDGDATTAAAAVGVQTYTTLRVLAHYKRSQLVQKVGPILNRMVDERFWLAPELQLAFLDHIGE